MLLLPGSFISFFFGRGGGWFGRGGLAPQEIVNIGLNADSYQHLKFKQLNIKFVINKINDCFFCGGLNK